MGQRGFEEKDAASEEDSLALTFGYGDGDHLAHGKAAAVTSRPAGSQRVTSVRSAR